MDAYKDAAIKDAAIKFAAGHTLTGEERDALVMGMMLGRTLSQEEVTEATLLGLNDPSPTARIKMIERTQYLGSVKPSILKKLEDMAGDELCPGDRHPGVRQTARETLEAFAARIH